MMARDLTLVIGGAEPWIWLLHQLRAPWRKLGVDRVIEIVLPTSLSCGKEMHDITLGNKETDERGNMIMEAMGLKLLIQWGNLFHLVDRFIQEVRAGIESWKI